MKRTRLESNWLFVRLRGWPQWPSKTMSEIPDDLRRWTRRSVALKASGYVAAGLSRVKFKDGRLSLSLSLSLSPLSRPWRSREGTGPSIDPCPHSRERVEAVVCRLDGHRCPPSTLPGETSPRRPRLLSTNLPTYLPTHLPFAARAKPSVLFFFLLFLFFFFSPLHFPP